MMMKHLDFTMGQIKRYEERYAFYYLRSLRRWQNQPGFRNPRASYQH